MELEDVDYDPPSERPEMPEQYPHLLVRLHNGLTRPIDVRSMVPTAAHPTLHMASPDHQEQFGRLRDPVSAVTYSAAASLLIHLASDQPSLYARMAAQIGVLITSADEFCAVQWQKLACIAICNTSDFIPVVGTSAGTRSNDPMEALRAIDSLNDLPDWERYNVQAVPRLDVQLTAPDVLIPGQPWLDQAHRSKQAVFNPTFVTVSDLDRFDAGFPPLNLRLTAPDCTADRNVVLDTQAEQEQEEAPRRQTRAVTGARNAQDPGPANPSDAGVARASVSPDPSLSSAEPRRVVSIRPGRGNREPSPTASTPEGLAPARETLPPVALASLPGWPSIAGRRNYAEVLRAAPPRRVTAIMRTRQPPAQEPVSPVVETAVPFVSAPVASM